jgi:hypothetical protein
MTDTKIIATSAADGSFGFDCNTIVRPADAARFVKAGYTFAIRYVPRVGALPHDITAAEFRMLLNAGLGVMLVQHVERAGPPWWPPLETKGMAYGERAAEYARDIGYPIGATLWLDLEGIVPKTDPETVIRYCNAWFDKVRAVGYQPGIYVGYNAILNASQLYQRLKFQRYWSAYNLDKDQYPGTRGVCMQQHEAHGLFAAPRGIVFPIDVNTVHGDKLGGLPTLAASFTSLPG